MKTSSSTTKILLFVLLAIVLVISAVRLVFNIQAMDITRIVLNVIVILCMLAALFVNFFSGRRKGQQKF